MGSIFHLTSDVLESLECAAIHYGTNTTAYENGVNYLHVWIFTTLTLTLDFSVDVIDNVSRVWCPVCLPFSRQDSCVIQSGFPLHKGPNGFDVIE